MKKPEIENLVLLSLFNIEKGEKWQSVKTRRLIMLWSVKSRHYLL
jgi:hypothetical protein